VVGLGGTTINDKNVPPHEEEKKEHLQVKPNSKLEMLFEQKMPSGTFSLEN
jgi:hypothetical protein